MIICPAYQRMPILGRGRELRRLAKAFTARHGITIGLARRSLRLWTLIYPVSASRQVHFTGEAVIVWSILKYLMTITARGDAPCGYEVVDACLLFAGRVLDDSNEGGPDDHPDAEHC